MFDQLISPDEVMPLSQAIRLGAKLRPQAFGALFVDGGSCSLGAAYEAVGYTVRNGQVIVNSSVPRAWVKIAGGIGKFDCPVTGCNQQRDLVLGLVTHLNDRHHWTRERIADFIELHEISDMQERDLRPTHV